MSYAGSIYDPTLDRSYEYDQVGRLTISHSGAEARAAAWTGQWGTMDGPYSQDYSYDAWGNMTQRHGWGGEVQGGGAGETSTKPYTYTNNRRTDSGFTYDPAGNLTFDGGQTFNYDVTGQQTYATYMSVIQQYDGDGLRIKKTENSVTKYYLRSSVLGGQVVAELNDAGGWQRGYVYQGSSLLAVQDSGVYWVHEDPITKSKRVTNVYGSEVSRIELDPWGADTNRSSNAAFQPKKFTSYSRDDNGTDEAMFRRYNRWHSRFDQPDPYEGSYDRSDPQSFNRYAYVQNDPVTFVDPSGLMPIICGIREAEGGGLEYVDCTADYVFVLNSRFSGFSGVRGGAGPQSPTPTPCPGPIPEDIARQILGIALAENVDPTLLSVAMRHESSFGTNMMPNERWEGKGSKRHLVGWDVGPMQTGTDVWNKAPFTNGLTNPFGDIVMDQSTKKYESFNGNFAENIILAARAFRIDILPRSSGKDWRTLNADASGIYRGPAGYQQRYTEYYSEAPNDRKQFECLGKQTNNGR